MQVRQLMTSEVAAVRPSSSLEAAVRLLADRHVSALPVVDDRGYVVGILSESDVLPRGGPLGRRPLTVREVMTPDPVTTLETTDVPEVAHLLATRGWKSLPVTDDHERLVGVISRSDIIRALA